MPNITTSIPMEIYNLAREKHIKWSEALMKGVIVLIREAQRIEIFGERVTDESIIAKKDQAIENMRETIEKLEASLEMLKKGGAKENG